MIQDDTPGDDATVLERVIDILLDYWLSLAELGTEGDDNPSPPSNTHNGYPCDSVKA